MNMYQGDSVIETYSNGIADVAAEILELSDLPFAVLLPNKEVKFCSVSLSDLFEGMNSEELLSDLAFSAEDMTADELLNIEVNNETYYFSSSILMNGCMLLRLSDETANSHAADDKQTLDIDSELAILRSGLEALADCNLDLKFSEFDNFQNSELGNYLHTTVANITEAIKQINKSCTHIITTTTNINSQSQDLSNRSQLQSTETVNTSRSMDELRITIADNATHATEAVSVSEDAVRIASDGHESVKKLIDSIDGIYSCSQQMNKIIETVDLIAFQTNILSLNAAVEAAHAGEHGRGFAIVAQEVRSLAKRSKTASGEIKELIHSTMSVSKQAKEISTETGQVVSEMTDRVNTISTALSEINRASQEQTVGVEQVSHALSEITALADHNYQEAVTLSENTDTLSGEVDQMQDVISVFRLSDKQVSHPLHQEVVYLVQQAAEELSGFIEGAVDNHYISMDDLFDRDYKLIPDTNPERYETRFDRYIDEQVMPLQETWLSKNPAVIYLIISDENGYVPTHNLAFSQPLTGDPIIDIAKNRTKRIFTDRVGQSVGKHKEPYLIQTYRRDTGELMFDMSVPLFIKGKHWGGVRAGYRIMSA